MTDQELLDLYNQRMAALAETGRPATLLRDMPKPMRETVDRASARFRATEQLIVKELTQRRAPAHLPGVTLWLTADGLNFAALDRDTMIPLGWSGTYAAKYMTRGLLKKYPSERGVKLPPQSQSAHSQ
jgi:hypothetical protein